jgi:hypothetical protein
VLSISSYLLGRLSPRWTLDSAFDIRNLTAECDNDLLAMRDAVAHDGRRCGGHAGRGRQRVVKRASFSLTASTLRQRPCIAWDLCGPFPITTSSLANLPRGQRLVLKLCIRHLTAGGEKKNVVDWKTFDHHRGRKEHQLVHWIGGATRNSGCRPVAEDRR